MKTVIEKIMLLPISFLAACGNKNQQVKDFIPGAYVNHVQSAYSIADDTLQIIGDAATGNNYRISRETGFIRIISGKLQPKEQQVKQLNGLWDMQKQILQIMQNGIILIFQPGDHKLVIQNSGYRKL